MIVGTLLWELLLITHIRLILDPNTSRFINTDCVLWQQYDLKNRSAFSCRLKRHSSFNCIKSLKMFISTDETSNHICGQSFTKCQPPKENQRIIFPYATKFTIRP